MENFNFNMIFYIITHLTVQQIFIKNHLLPGTVKGHGISDGLVVLGAMGYSGMESWRWGVEVGRFGMYVPDEWRLEGREGLSPVVF